MLNWSPIIDPHLEPTHMDRHTVLHFEAQTTVLVAEGFTVTVPVGPRGIAESTLHHDPSTPGELERAIDVIEDALAATRLQQTRRGTLVSSSALLRDLPALGEAGSALDREQVERLFQALASRARGTPVSSAEMPDGKGTAAALLILRELMHHLGFDRIAISDSALKGSAG